MILFWTSSQLNTPWWSKFHFVLTFKCDVPRSKTCNYVQKLCIITLHVDFRCITSCLDLFYASLRNYTHLLLCTTFINPTIWSSLQLRILWKIHHNMFPELNSFHWLFTWAVKYFVCCVSQMLFIDCVKQAESITGQHGFRFWSMHGWKHVLQL